MLNDKTKSAQERLDYAVLLLNDEDHDCKGSSCQICLDKMELADEIKQTNKEEDLAQTMPQWEFDETELID